MDRKVALITGGSTGIGRATALAFANAGARVGVANPHKFMAGEDVVKLIHARGGQALFVPADETKAAEVPGLVTRTVEHFGRLDYAFNTVVWLWSDAATFVTGIALPIGGGSVAQ